MEYKDMIDTAIEQGLSSEEAMFAGIKNVDKLLDIIKESNPTAYWKFMRKSHASLFGEHYNEDFAKYDVNNIHYTDRNGLNHTGEHWSYNDIQDATNNKIFNKDVTDWDKYVAYNAMYADLCKSFGDADILEAAYLFYFADEDAPNGKIWRYMYAMNK